jgi:hypothetical protein
VKLTDQLKGINGPWADAAVAKRAALRIEELEKEISRYEWLRTQYITIEHQGAAYVLTGSSLDEFIDAAKTL